MRIYSAWGLTVLDIAKIAFVTGMTFWLGNAFLLGGATAYAPEAASAVDHLPPWINRADRARRHCPPSSAICFGSRRGRARVGRSGWRIVLPSMRFTLVQIGIGALDLTLVTLAMYALLPPEPAGRFRDRAGRLPDSHAPRDGQPCARRPRRHRGHGAGRACRNFQREELLAALLTFRALYFVLPLFLATLSLGLRELCMLARPASGARAMTGA